MEPKDREKWERRGREAYLLNADEFKRKFFEYLYKNGTANVHNVPWSLFGEFQGDLEKALGPLFVEVYAAHARDTLKDLPITFSWDLIHERARDWSKTYTFDLVRGLTNTDRKLLQDAISRNFEEGMTLDEVRDLIQQSPAFSAARADMIATTEITRASVQGELWAVDEVRKAGFPMESIWNTNADELVCPICGPRNQKPQGKGWDEPPPAHPRCRCWLNHRPVGVIETPPPQAPVVPAAPVDPGTVPTPDRVSEMGLKKYIQTLYPTLPVEENSKYKPNPEFETRVAEELYEMKLAGYREDWLPTALRYGYKSDFSGRRNLGVVGFYRHADGKITLNSGSSAWSKEARERNVNSGWWASDSIVKRELANRAHYVFWEDLTGARPGSYVAPRLHISLTEKPIIQSGVSQYATYDSMETVAEIMSSLMSGRTYGPDVIRIYKKYGGPPLPGKVEYTPEELQVLETRKGADYLDTKKRRYQ